MDQEPLIEAFVEKCRQLKLKLTPQRLMLYRELIKSVDHPSADSIYRKARKIFPNISFDTVNRTLVTFSRMGLVRMVEGYGDPRRFDSNPQEHHHFRCLDCLDIIDIYDPSFDKITIPDKIGRSHLVLGKKVILEGICSECRTQHNRRNGNQGE